jgi:hypothetical protein
MPKSLYSGQKIPYGTKMNCKCLQENDFLQFLSFPGREYFEEKSE